MNNKEMSLDNTVKPDFRRDALVSEKGKSNKKNKSNKKGEQKKQYLYVHGSNIKGYISEPSPEFLKELEESKKSVKSKVLSYATDDFGNIDCFTDIYGKYIKFNYDKKCWMCWNGRVWEKDVNETVVKYAQHAMKFRRKQTLKRLEKEPVTNQKELLSHIKSCCNQKCVKAILEGAKVRLGCRDFIFDTHPRLLNVLNGTINLKTGVLHKHDRKNYITKFIPIMYSDTARSVIFEKFLTETFSDDELIDYTKRLYGYCATGETREQVVHFFVGNGANGKSTLDSIIQYTLNDYAKVIPAKVLTDVERVGSASPEIAQLPGKRLVCCSELNCTDSLNEGKIKIMSSGETLSTRKLYCDAFTFEPEFKCIIDTNYLPKITGTDFGIWRRIRVVPFNHTVSKDKMNKDLLSQLKKNPSAILNWIVEGAKKYYEEGLDIESCEAVKTATNEYRKSQDTLGGFIKSCTAECENSSVRARDVYERYLIYCNENLISPISETKFGKDFKVRSGYETAKDKKSRKYINIKLK